MESFVTTLNICVALIGLGYIVHSLLDKYLAHPQQASKKGKTFEKNKNAPQTFVDSKLSALEKYMLLMDRLSIANLIFRTPHQELNAKELHGALLLTIHKEYEYNAVQQLYLSEELWSVLTLTKQELIQHINAVKEKVDDSAPATELSNALLQTVNRQLCEPAKKALRLEASSLYFF